VAIPDWTQQTGRRADRSHADQGRSGSGQSEQREKIVETGMSDLSIYAVVSSPRSGSVWNSGRTISDEPMAKLAHKGGARIEQIQLSYDHASLTTTAATHALLWCALVEGFGVLIAGLRNMGRYSRKGS
jgi:hypothetical protein